MSRRLSLVCVLGSLAAYGFMTSPTSAQSFVSITSCTVTPSEVAVAPGESGSFVLSVDNDGDWAWVTIVIDGKTIVDQAEQRMGANVEFSHAQLDAEVDDSATYTWWAVDPAGARTGDPLCTLTISLATPELTVSRTDDALPVVGFPGVPWTALAFVLLGAGGAVRRRIAPR